jgi:site-specific DNA-methyltransferase (adenine-specific)
VGNFNLYTDEQKEWYSISTNRSSEHLGDCLELMPLIADESIDMILCDLPYGTTACKWDIVIPLDELWKEYNRIIKKGGAIVLFGTEPFSSHLRLSNLANYKYDWVWDKVTARGHLVAKKRPMQQTETISVFCKGTANYFPIMTKRPADKIKVSKEYARTDIIGGGKQHENNIKLKTYDEWYPKNILTFSAANTSNDKLHPTAKPIDLLKYLILTYTSENEIILDNTAGAFSTAIACLETKRKYIVMEKEKEYYNKGLKRILEWEREQKTKLF